jgi:hypothetical protein
MVPPRTDRERLDDRPELLTRGRESTSRNQVRVRINGGKTAPTNERLLRMFAGAAEFCAVRMKRTQRKDPGGHDDFVHRHIRAGAAAALGTD